MLVGLDLMCQENTSAQYSAWNKDLNCFRVKKALGAFGSAAEGPRQWGPKGAKGGTVKRKAAAAAGGAASSAGSGSGTAGAAVSGAYPAPKRARQQVRKGITFSNSQLQI